MVFSFSKRKENIQDGNHELNSQNTPNKSAPWSIIICISCLSPTFYSFNRIVILTYFKMAIRNCQNFFFQWYHLNSSREHLKTVLKYINLERNISEILPHKKVVCPPPPKPNVLENSKPVNLKNFKFKFIRYNVSRTNGIIEWNRIVVFDFLYP